jgi:deoxyribonuclease-4
VKALERGDAIGAEVVQIFTQSPRSWKPSQYAPDELASYRAAQAQHPRVTTTFCHATYLINLATADPDLLARSRACLAANLAVARGIGSAGLVLHIGSHRGLGFRGCVSQVVDCLEEALAGADATEASAPGGPAGPGRGDPGDGRCPILLENAAGAGGTVGRTLEELAEVLARADLGADLGICLDTQHLWASGVAFASVEEADAVVAHVETTVGLERLGCIHLNDSKVPFGANRDRHANIGDGSIGTEGLAALIGHPAFDRVPAVLEVPGAGDGPRTEDVAAARRALDLGRSLRC